MPQDACNHHRVEAQWVTRSISPPQELPELMLPYLIYLLAHHPDFPEPLPADEGANGATAAGAAVACPDAEAFQPFALMLQFGLEPLLAEGGGQAAGASLPAILKALRYLRLTQDAQVRLGVLLLGAGAAD